MGRTLRTLWAVVVSAALIASLGACTDKGKGANALAEDFTLQDLNGKDVRLSDYRGKAVLLEFWATWCPPCRASIPGIEKIHKTYKDKGLSVLAVSLDEGDWASVKSFAAEAGITYTVLKGTEDVAEQYHVRSIPMVLILDREGRIARRYLGGGEEEEIEKDIKAVL